MKLKSLDVKLFSNGGSAFDLSGPVMDRALFHVDGPYFWPEFRAEGVPCKTVQPPHTAYRGFGGPQGLAACEHVMDHLALACQVSGDDLRRQNLYSNGDSTHFGMIMGEEFAGQWNVPRMWDRLYDELKVAEKRREIDVFNSKNKWKKRGFAITPTKFGIAFTAKFMNQGGALVHLYTDGTVLVSHGGTEMGQGLVSCECQASLHIFRIMQVLNSNSQIFFFVCLSTQRFVKLLRKLSGSLWRMFMSMTPPQTKLQILSLLQRQ